ncbi:MAG: glycosyltransferase family 2 protein [Kiritimatiellia bacterium]|jgi:dolichol-phosphate mannosyltransferase|nr:glycosyltransferase family 2 protein [Kiritimatiellia bacterium]
MNKPRPFLSVVTPVYMAEACVEELSRRLVAALDSISPDFEIIMVEDASPDRSWETMVRILTAEPRCKGIRLARNFGQHYAITAGLEHAAGEWIVVMDCDLQDQPEEIAKLFQTAKHGNFDVVFGRRFRRNDLWLKRMSSKCFYAAYNYFTDARFDNTVANFSISRRPVIAEFLRMREHNRSFPLFIRWLGFSVGYVDVVHAERFAGKTSYDFRKLLRLSAESIISQSNKPLHLSIAIGLLLALGSFLVALYFIAKYFFLGIPVTGWTSMIVSLWFIGGVILMNLGVLGLYLGRVFNEVKNRPLYVVRERIGFGCFPTQEETEV